MLKHILILFSIGFFFTGLASLQAAGVNPVKGQAFRCELPAPENFQIVSTTSTSVTLSWSPLPGAVAYEVRAYILNSPTPAVQIVTSNSATFNNVNPNFVYRYQVAGICENGDRGEWTSILGKGTGIVLDLVADRHGAPELVEVAPDLGTISTYTLNWVAGDSYWFKIEANGASYSRYVFVVPDFGGHFTFAKEHEYLVTYPYGLRSFVGWIGPFLANDVDLIRICYGFNPDNTGIGDITLTMATPSIFKITWTNIQSNFSFKLFKRVPEGLKATEDRIDSSKDVSAIIQVSPNPFESALQITGLNPNAETTLQLFHFDGRLAQAQQSTTAQNYNLNTQHLPPGVYFLRIESEGVQKTHKLVKI